MPATTNPCRNCTKFHKGPLVVRPQAKGVARGKLAGDVRFGLHISPLETHVGADLVAQGGHVGSHGAIAEGHHGNLVFNAVASLVAFGTAADERRLCWLPLSHIYARTSIFTPGWPMAAVWRWPKAARRCWPIVPRCSPQCSADCPIFMKRLPGTWSNRAGRTSRAFCRAARRPDSCLLLRRRRPTGWPSFSPVAA